MYGVRGTRRPVTTFEIHLEMRTSWRRQNVCMMIFRSEKWLREKRKAWRYTKVTRAERPCLMTQQRSLSDHEWSLNLDSNMMYIPSAKFLT
jgi:hypothetical protein